MFLIPNIVRITVATRTCACEGRKSSRWVPHIRLYLIAFNADFIWFVVCPERAVASADIAEAFVGWFAERWEGDGDGFAVASYTQVGLLWGRHCGYVTA